MIYILEIFLLMSVTALKYPIPGLNKLATGAGTVGYYNYLDSNIVSSVSIDISYIDLGTGTEPGRAVEKYARNLGVDTDDAGHILAKNLGGLAEPINIFPQLPHINRGSYRMFEENIYNYLSGNNLTIASLKWTFEYNKNETRPAFITYCCNKKCKIFNNGNDIVL
jgi:hypothetical protein